jgi:hypothetical protein
LANFMRLSLRERRTRNRVQRSVAGNPGRDDKETGAVHEEWLLNRGIFQIGFGQLLLNLAQAAVLGRLCKPDSVPQGRLKIAQDAIQVSAY